MILSYLVAIPVADPKHELGTRHPLFCGSTKPLHCLAAVLSDTLAKSVRDGEIELR